MEWMQCIVRSRTTANLLAPGMICAKYAVMCLLLCLRSCLHLNPTPQLLAVVLYPHIGTHPPPVSVAPFALDDASPAEDLSLAVSVGPRTDFIAISRNGVRKMTAASLQFSAHSEVVVARARDGHIEKLVSSGQPTQGQRP